MKQLQRYLDKKIYTIGFVDIETLGDNFKAETGSIVTWVLEKYDIKTGKSTTFYNYLNKNDFKYHNKKDSLNYDEFILESLVEKMKECDMIVTHYGTWFDIPFIRTRNQIMNFNFIKHEDKIRFADTWRTAKLSGSYKRNSLENACKAQGFKMKKTIVDYNVWKLVYYGKRKYINYILHHNFIDVKLTKKLWLKTEMSMPIPSRYY